MRRVWLVGLAVVVATAGTACGTERRPRPASAAKPPPFSLSQASSVTKVEMADFGLTPTATSITGPRVVLDLHNGSTHGYLHELVVTRVDQDDEEPSFGEVKVASDQRQQLAVELDPGRYQFACFVKTKNPDGTETEHFLRNMKVEVTVTG